MSAPMGSMFNERRAARRQQQQQQDSTSGADRGGGGVGVGKSPGFLEIQQEQQRESDRLQQQQQQQQQHHEPRRNRSPVPRQYDGNRNPRSGGGFDRGGSRGFDRGGRGHHHHHHNNNNNRGSGDRNRNRPHVHSLPLEQGKISALLDKYGFIYCAVRPAELFFHYSEFRGFSEDLSIGDEVEFRVGPASDGGDKLAAYGVEQLRPGTVLWEKVESDGKIFHGCVELSVKDTATATATTATAGPGRKDRDLPEGTIRIVELQHQDEDEEDHGAYLTTPTDDLIHFHASDHVSKPKPRNSAAHNPRSSDSATPGRALQARFLSKNDLLQFSLVTQLRTMKKYARDISLIISERDRQKIIREKKLLQTATQERGVISAIKDDYGFLKSNRRKEQIYFHFSNNASDGDLSEGQDVEFLVVKDQEGKGKPSARRISLLPRGSVIFERTVATGLIGRVKKCPVPSPDRSLRDTRAANPSTFGTVSLFEPLLVPFVPPLDADDNDHENTNKDDHEEEHERKEELTELVFRPDDSPGGSYAANRDGSKVGLWIREGDTILFDVIQETVDGTCRVAPTKRLSASSSSEEDNDHEEGESKVRLISTAFGGRAEGIVSAIRDNYGFIHCAERNVDAYFRFYELFPTEIQRDLLRGEKVSEDNDIISGLAQLAKSIEEGTEVSFDLSLQTPLVTHSGSATGAKGKKQIQSGGEKENLKAQRILVLPKGSVALSRVLASGVKGTVSKVDPKQPFAGNIDLEYSVKGMSLEERHPYVAKLLDSLKEEGSNVTFHDIQSEKDALVVKTMAEARDGMEWTYTPAPKEVGKDHPGRLTIVHTAKSSHQESDDASSGHAKGSESTAGIEHEDDQEKKNQEIDKVKDAATDSDGLPQSAKKKKKPKIRTIKTIRYDKHSFSPDELMLLPSKGDMVQCDIVQSRRTGAITIVNIHVTERNTVNDNENDQLGEVSVSKKAVVGEKGVGIVSEYVASRQFGFISLMDENMTKRDTLFFHTTSVIPMAASGEGSGDKKLSRIQDKNNNNNDNLVEIRKGDEVAFDVGVGKNGKSTAENIRVLPHGTLRMPPHKNDKHLCRGFILMEPSHTTLENTPSHITNGTKSGPSSNNGSRWENVVKEDKKKDESTAGGSTIEQGCILLLSDPSDSFAFTKSKTTTKTGEGGEIRNETNEEEEEENVEKDPSSQKIDPQCSAVGTHLRYKNAAHVSSRTAATSTTTTTPSDGSAARRGDLVSFMKTKHGRGVRDIRVVSKAAAHLIRGHLENIMEGKADFVTEGGRSTMVYNVDLKEVVSCDIDALKDQEAVEGILHEQKIYGICRTKDIYLNSKIGGMNSSGSRGRPRLNLTVRKELKGMGGKIVAQSGMAKGPDGSNGFLEGWTKRTSKYDTNIVETETTIEEKE